MGEPKQVGQEPDVFIIRSRKRPGTFVAYSLDGGGVARRFWPRAFPAEEVEGRRASFERLGLLVAVEESDPAGEDIERQIQAVRDRRIVRQRS